MVYQKPANRLEVHKEYSLGVDAEKVKKTEGVNVYDTIILSDTLAPLIAQEDKEFTLAIHLLTPEDRRLKYCTRLVRAKVSSNPAKYKERLYILYQRGLMHPKPWSIDIIREEPGLLIAEATATMARS